MLLDDGITPPLSLFPSTGLTQHMSAVHLDFTGSMSTATPATFNSFESPAKKQKTTSGNVDNSNPGTSDKPSDKPSGDDNDPPAYLLKLDGRKCVPSALEIGALYNHVVKEWIQGVYNDGGLVVDNENYLDHVCVNTT